MYGYIIAFLSLFICFNSHCQKAELNGSFEMKVDSTYHSLPDVKKKIKNSVNLSFLSQDLNPVIKLGKGKITKNQSWEINEKTVHKLLQESYSSLTWNISNENRTHWVKWLGKVSNKTVSYKGKLNVKIIDVNENHIELALDGNAKVENDGGCSSRMGPNYWRESWTPTIKGKCKFDRKKGLFSAIELDVNGKLEGSYYNNGGSHSDLYNGMINLSLKSKLKDINLNTNLEKIIKSLSEGNFKERRNAKNAIKKLDEANKDILISKLEQSDDPELKAIAKELSTAKQADNNDQGETVDWVNKQFTK